MTLASSKGLGERWAICSLKAVPPSDLAHDLFPGAILIFLHGPLCGHGVKDGCGPQRALMSEHLMGLRLEGQS